MSQTSVPHLGTQDSSAMVSWFMNQEMAPLRMDEKNVGGHKYYLCSSELIDEAGAIPICGRGITKLEAATRCIGEWLERKAAFEFFRSQAGSIETRILRTGTDSEISISSAVEKSSPLPMEFWTTNGWAVHTDQNISIQNALHEALERSLLISSFLRWGWHGFIEIGKTSVDDMEIRSCLSRYKTKQLSAGFAICTDHVTQGLSFGHFCENTELISQSPKWAQALYEAMDKFGADLDQVISRDPLAADAVWYLKNAADPNLSDDKTEQEKIKFSSCRLHSEDLAQKWNLPFPLYSSFVFGGDLVPLFVPRELTTKGRKFVIDLANSLGFDPTIPERIPVL